MVFRSLPEKNLNDIFYYQVLFEGDIGQSSSGDIAIDDAWFDDDSCPDDGTYAFVEQWRQQ